MENLRPNEQRAKNAITLIWIVLALEIISLISGYFQYDLLQKVAKGGEISNETATANDTREQLIAVIYMIVYIISAVTFIQWFRRAYFNLHSLVPNLTYSEGWAAGSWFVPVIGFFRPYQIMVELYNKTIARLVERKLFENQSFDLSFVKVWWALWIIVSIIGRVVYKYISEAETLDKFIDFTIFSMVESILYIPLSLITIKVIKVYSNFENILFNDVTIEPVLNLDSDNKVL